MDALINDYAVIEVEIASRGVVECDISSVGTISVDVDIPEQVGGRQYSGDYVVTPKAHDSTVLPTNGLLMMDDVTVVQIPYYETSNVSGSTVYIANEV